MPKWLGWTAFFVGVFFGWSVGRIDGRVAGEARGRQAYQREQLTDEGCKQIAKEPELWECPDGRRVKVRP